MVGGMSYFSMSYLAIFNRAKVPVGEAYLPTLREELC